MAIWSGDSATKGWLLLAFRNNCDECKRERFGHPLCAEHRRLIETDQRFLDTILYWRTCRDDLIAAESSRDGGVSRG